MNPWRRVLLLCIPVAGLAHGGPPSEMFDGLEARLLGAKRVRIETVIEASGVLQASIKGFMEAKPANRARFEYAGTFAGKPLDIAVVSTGGQTTLRSGDMTRTEGTGPESNRALLLGLTRMGLLHNIARAAGSLGPDHAAGGVTPWIMPDNFQPVTFAQVGPMVGMPSLGFRLLVNEQPSAEIRLWFNPDTGLPRRREQTVVFPSGTMKVVETYPVFEIE